MTGIQALAVLAGAAAIGLALARIAAHRGLSTLIPVGFGLLLTVPAFLIRISIGAEGDLALTIAVGLLLGAALYYRWDQWHDARRVRLQDELDGALKDVVVTGPERDPRDLEPGESQFQVMPRAMERKLNRQQRRRKP